MSYLDLQPRPEAVQETQEPSFAEPPAILPRRDEDDWFASLEVELQNAEVIRIVGAEWLRPDSLRERVDALLQRLMHRGVRVERHGE